MRVVKEAEVRKQEILDTAAVLFAEKGFDNTSVNDILERLGIAKGTLYYHFKSKECIMDALIERQTEILLSQAKKAAGDQDIPVVERIARTILALRVKTAETAEEEQMIEQLHKPQNALMQQKTKRILFQQVPPILAEVLKDGIAQGIFKTPHPLECMEMALCYLDALLDDNIFELTEQEQFSKIQTFLSYLEQLLGAQAGELTPLLQIFSEGDI